MLTLRQWIRAAALFLAVVSPLQAGTWIVDQNGGPGVHFTDLPPAIAAAAPDDLILVRAGVYTPFTLNKGLAIIGTLGAGPAGTLVNCCIPSNTIVTAPAGEIVLLADLRFAGELLVRQSVGVVVMDRVTTMPHWPAGLEIADCADVRLSRHTGNKILVKNSRYEIASSSLQGKSGSSGGYDGETALRVRGNSNGLVTRTSCIGGDGGDMPIGTVGDGGDGGAGIWLNDTFAGTSAGLTLLLAGGGVSTVRGGGGGDYYAGWYGDDGDGLYNYKCGVWHSGCTFIPGNSTHSGALPVRYVPGPGSFDTPISPDDPTLELVGTPSYGGTVQLNVYATPGSVVRLTLGNTPIITATPGVRVDKLVSPDETLFLGVVSASGVISHTIHFPRAFTTGMAFYAQAFMFDNTAGETRRTNSVPLIMR